MDELLQYRHQHLYVDATRGFDGATPLMVACLECKTLIALKLLEARPGLLVNVQRKDGTTALFIAAARGQIEVVNALLRRRGIRVNTARKPWGETALYMACADGNQGVVRKLLEVQHHSQCDINQPTKTGMTPLHAACAFKHAKVVKLLLEHSAHRTGEDSEGRTPFMYACECGDEAALQALLQTSISDCITERRPLEVFYRRLLLCKDKAGNFAPQYAARMGHLHVLKYLYKGEHIPDSEDSVREVHVEGAVIPSTLQELEKIKGALRVRVHNSYQVLPEYMQENGLGPDRSASSYLVASSLLATITSLGFLTPPGGYDPNKGQLSAAATSVGGAFPVLLVFMMLNMLCLFFALATILLSIKIMAPVGRRMNPLDAAKGATHDMKYAAVTLICAVLFAAGAFAAAAVYPLFVMLATMDADAPGAGMAGGTAADMQSVQDKKLWDMRAVVWSALAFGLLLFGLTVFAVCRAILPWIACERADKLACQRPLTIGGINNI